MVLGALLCGSFDLLFAFIYFGQRNAGATPERILRSIASGWLGGPAAKEGMFPVYLGFFLHFAIATGIAAVFWLASRFVPRLLRWPLVVGPLYGAIAYCVMNWAVVPLSAAGAKGGFPDIKWVEFVGHLFLVGLPVVWAVREFAPAAKARGGAPVAD